MGIEPTYSAWKADVLPLNHTCIIIYNFVEVTGFEPATPWSQTRCSSQTEPHLGWTFFTSFFRDASMIICINEAFVNLFLVLFRFFILEGLQFLCKFLFQGIPVIIGLL